MGRMSRLNGNRALSVELLEHKEQVMRVLVTGAAGYIGRHVVKQVLDMGHEVIASDFRFDDVDPRAEQSKVSLFSGDKDIYEQFGKCLIIKKKGINYGSQNCRLTRTFHRIRRNSHTRRSGG